MTHPTDALRLVRDDHEVIKRCVERMPPLYMRGQTEGSYLHSDIATLIDIVGRLSAAPASPLPGGGWQDISTAPKDGTEVLIYRDGWQEAPRAKWGDHDGEDDQGNSIVFGGWFMASEWFTYGCEDGFLGWNDDSTVMPTHWMPLPSPPSEVQK